MGEPVECHVLAQVRGIYIYTCLGRWVSTLDKVGYDFLCTPTPWA